VARVVRVFVWASERGFGHFCTRCIRSESRELCQLERVALSDQPCRTCGTLNVESSASAE
jgi:hypothetical protein